MAHWFGRLRLASGLVLFTFVGTHLLNHSLGLIGLSAMENGRQLFVLAWRSWPGTLLLYGAIAVHLSLVLTAIYRRRSWRQVKFAEVVQVVMGLCLPPLVVYHIIATRGVAAQFGMNDNYAYVIQSLWVSEPWLGLQQTIVVQVAWLHGCIGVHFWLRLKPWYGRARVYLYTAAILLPVLAVLGFVAGGREVVQLAKDPIWAASFRENLHYPGPVAADWAAHARMLAFGLMSGLVLVLALAWVIHDLIERRLGLLTLTYPMGRKVMIRPGTSILEASRQAGIPHASVCGGRGRCSTCRVRVGFGRDDLPPPSDEESRVLARVGAPQGVRLACQLRPSHDLSVMPLLPAAAQPKDGYRQPAYLQGMEQEIAILFADLRAFTQFAEQKLPYDVVFVINQYFRSMGQAVERNGGQLDKFIGDGVMALFGLTTGSERGCRDALAAARAMAEALDQLNETLAHDLAQPLKIGIGLHAGTVIVGEMGYARAISITAIGDAVNTASRLETMTKEFGVQMVVSRRVAKRAGVDLRAFPRRAIEVRGRREPMTVYLVASALDLPSDLHRTSRPADVAAPPAAAQPAASGT